MRVWSLNWDLSSIPKRLLISELLRREGNTGSLAWSERCPWDLGTIPEGLFNSEQARRNNAKRKTKSGGVVWGEHVPGYSRCRCMDCITMRVEREAAAPPPRPRGRPPKPIDVNFVPPPPQKRGRKPKPVALGPKRPQGRPRKVIPAHPVAAIEGLMSGQTPA